MLGALDVSPPSLTESWDNSPVRTLSTKSAILSLMLGDVLLFGNNAWVRSLFVAVTDGWLPLESSKQLALVKSNELGVPTEIDSSSFLHTGRVAEEYLPSDYCKLQFGLNLKL